MLYYFSSLPAQSPLVTRPGLRVLPWPMPCTCELPLFLERSGPAYTDRYLYHDCFQHLRKHGLQHLRCTNTRHYPCHLAYMMLEDTVTTAPFGGEA
jgi:hypothetical protein